MGLVSEVSGFGWWFQARPLFQPIQAHAHSGVSFLQETPFFFFSGQQKNEAFGCFFFSRRQQNGAPFVFLRLSFSTSLPHVGRDLSTWGCQGLGAEHAQAPAKVPRPRIGRRRRGLSLLKRSLSQEISQDARNTFERPNSQAFLDGLSWPVSFGNMGWLGSVAVVL